MIRPYQTFAALPVVPASFVDFFVWGVIFLFITMMKACFKHCHFNLPYLMIALAKIVAPKFSE